MTTTLPLWYKVRHPWFDPGLAYRAVWFSDYSETAWPQIWFVLPTGHTVGVQNHRCTCLPRPSDPLSRPLATSEKNLPHAGKLPGDNPDLNTDM